MTETQGTTALGRGDESGAPAEGDRESGASTSPVDAETEATAPAGRAAVGRATVPASESPAESSSGGGAAARFTRAPGMAAPPSESPALVAVSAAVPVVSASAPPVSAPPAPGTMRSGAAGRAAVGTMAPGRPVGAARVTEAVRAARGSSSAAATRGPRRARLTVKRVDPWSVMKFSFAVSLVLFIVIIVATAVLYLALDAMGVFDSLNESLGDLLTSAGGAEGGGGFKITAKGVIGTAGLLGAVNVVLVTALATLSAFIYNVCADLVGGIELTLSERD